MTSEETMLLRRSFRDVTQGLLLLAIEIGAKADVVNQLRMMQTEVSTLWAIEPQSAVSTKSLKVDATAVVKASCEPQSK